MIFHIPHSSTVIPSNAKFSLSQAELEHELLVMTDHFTDDLFTARIGPGDVAVIAKTSRLVVDVERFPNDADEPMAKRGMGVIYTKSSSLGELRPAPSVFERKRLLQRYYWPHHEELEKAVAAQLEQNLNVVTILDCHSFPSQPLPYEPDQAAERPDICIGTDSYHTTDELCALVSDSFKRNGYTVAVNTPYAGSMVPAAYYRKPVNVASIMIEVNRSLYMNERTGKKIRAGYERTKAMLSEVVDLLWEHDNFGHETGRLIREFAECVGSVEWDSGGPGGGAGTDNLYKLDDKFHWFHDAGVCVFDSFQEAVDGGFFTDNEATQDIMCSSEFKDELNRGK